jgi:hypothetical protein
MIVRSVDVNGDWNFGKGKNDYVRDNDAVAQMIKTRLLSFLGDCFFATTEGIDWFNLLGAKNQIALELAVSAVILNSPNITGIKKLSLVIDGNRQVTIKYNAQSTFGSISDIFQYDILQSV